MRDSRSLESLRLKNQEVSIEILKRGVWVYVFSTGYLLFLIIFIKFGGLHALTPFSYFILRQASMYGFFAFVACGLGIGSLRVLWLIDQEIKEENIELKKKLEWQQEYRERHACKDIEKKWELKLEEEKHRFSKLELVLARKDIEILELEKKFRTPEEATKEAISEFGGGAA